MKRISTIIAMALAALCLVAAGGDVLTGEDLAPGTINGDQVGTSVTYVKSANVLVQPRELTAEDAECAAAADPEVAFLSCSEPREGAGLRSVTIKCPSGNVASGSIIYPDDGIYLEQDYPVSDNAWRFEMENQSKAAVTVPVRVVCL